MHDLADVGPPLSGVRVVEFSENISGAYAGWLLASLGADVVKVEPPSGDPARCHGPFSPGYEGAHEHSGLFHALNGAKRSVVCNQTDVRGARAVAKILRSADLVLSDLRLADRRASGLDPGSLTDEYPGLVHVSVTPFGDRGPLVDAPGCALTISAFGGATVAIGQPDRAPLAPPFDLPLYEAGVNAAAAALTALLVKERRGYGQGVDVAAVDVIAYYVATNALMYVPCGKPWTRAGRSASRSGGAYPYGIFQCRDGLVALIGRSADDWKKLCEAMGNPQWSRREHLQDPFVIADRHAGEVDGYLSGWLARYTREELANLARDVGIALAPVLSIEEILRHPQFVGRGVFSRSVRIADRTFTPPRAPWSAGMMPLGLPKARAPLLGEHTAEVLSERRAVFAQAGAAGVDAKPSWFGDEDRPLAGLRVVDFSWVWSGPMVAATLADLGADVIKIEHRRRLDNARLRCRPRENGSPVEGPLEEVSYYFRQNNRGKRSVTVDLKRPEGVAVARRLISQSDVLIENLSRGVFDRVGLNLETVQASNPRLIVLSMSAAGGTGPISDTRAYAPVMTAMSGVESLVGYDDEPPEGMMTLAIGDPNAASHALVALIAALVERERTGRGRMIDVPQIESMIAPLGEAVAELQLADNDPAERRMAHPRFAPHGHYRCRGQDRWIAIAIDSSESWRRCAQILDSPDLLDEHLATADQRRKRAKLVDSLIAARTCDWERDALVSALLSAGVPAAPVHEYEEVLSHPHFADRELFHRLKHPVTGVHEVARVPWRLSRTPAWVGRSAPLVGEHTQDVLEDVLQLFNEEIAALEEDGVLS